MNHLSNTAKKLDTLFRILHIFLSILIVASVVGIAIIGAAFLFKLDPEMVGTGYTSLDVGFLELEIAPAFAPDPKLTLLQTAIRLALGFVCALFGRMCIRLLREILQPMSEGSPFTSIVTTNLKKLGKLTVILGIVLNVLNIADQAMAVFLLDLPGLLVGEAVTHVTGVFVFDFTFLVISAVFFLLSYVFQYGEELQQLSDETL